MKTVTVRLRGVAIAVVLALVATCLALVAPARAQAEEGWLWPVPSSQRVVKRCTGAHMALDIAGDSGADIVASRAGTVYHTLDGTANDANWDGYGQGVVIDHGDGYFTHYAHLSKVLVSEGARVTQGQTIGKMGSTGDATSVCLHFAIKTSPYGGNDNAIYNNVENITYLTESNPEPTWTLTADSVTVSNATLKAKVTMETRVRFSKVGLRIWDPSGQLVVNHAENVTITDTTMSVSYDVTNQLGTELLPATTYKVQFWCVADDTTYESPRKSLTTATAPALTATWSTSAEPDSSDAANEILSATVTVKRSVTFSRAGIEIWDKHDNSVVSYDEPASIEGTSMNIRFDLATDLGVGLLPDTAYTYRFRCVADGQLLYSEPGSFTTGGTHYFTVEFRANGHGEAPAPQTVRSGSYAWQPAEPSADGYAFNGWYRDSACTKPYDFNLPVRANLTLYAGWDRALTDISGAQVTLSFDQAPYSGRPIKPAVTVTLDGTPLVAGRDYDLAYVNNVEVGQATVNVEGEDRYTGSIAATFRIQRAENGWVSLGGADKGYGIDGKLITGWFDLGTSKYWFDYDGRMARGWTDIAVNGKVMHYYFNPTSGNLARNTWMTIDGKKYYFRESGNMATGWATITDGSSQKKFYFDEDGQMLTGWQQIGDKTYYFNPSGSMAVGWKTIGGRTYYLRESGSMATGWATIKDGSSQKKFYFDGDGRMLTGWQEIDNRTYYFRDSGAMATGWATIDGYKYFFNGTGTMAKGFTNVGDSYRRFFDDNGHMVTGWFEQDGKTYYFRIPSGAMQTGKATIDGKEYTFNAYGVLQGVRTMSDDEATVVADETAPADKPSDDAVTIADETAGTDEAAIAVADDKDNAIVTEDEATDEPAEDAGIAVTSEDEVIELG